MAYFFCHNCRKRKQETVGMCCPDCGEKNMTERRVKKTQNFSVRRAKIALFKEQSKAIADLPEPDEYVLRVMTQFTKLRTMKGLSQGEVADRIGINKGHIHSYENGKYYPSIRRMAEMAIAVGARLELSGWE